MTAPRSRGVIALLEENCTSCMICAQECPDWCIFIDAHTEVVPAVAAAGPAGGRGTRERTRNVLDRFAIDFSLCMYCGICVDVCPFDALFWAPDVGYAEFDVLGLTHERDRLRGWLAHVPPPPAADPGAEDPKEVSAARNRGTR
jgi:NADH-quinone oxidoreductase subunit I